MKYRLIFILVGLLLVCFSSGLTGESRSESNQLTQREGKIDLIRERLEQEKLNYRGTEIQVYNGNRVSLSPQQKEMMLAMIDDFKVNDNTGTSSQWYPGIAVDGSGNFAVTWGDGRNGNDDIYAQRYNSAGIPQGSNFKVNDDSWIEVQYYPEITMNGSGNFIIVWQDQRNRYSDLWDIYAQRYNSSGAPQGTNFKVNTDVGTAVQAMPAVAMDASGNFVITWMDERNGEFDIYAQRYNSSGTPQGSNFKVNDNSGASGHVYPAVAMSGSGNFVVTWYDDRNGNADIYAQRYNSAGTPQGSNFKVSDDAGTVDQIMPAIALDGSGNFEITWRDYRNGNYDIYAQCYNSSGSPQGSNFKVNEKAGTTTWMYAPAIATDGSGNFVIVWEAYQNDNMDIYGQKYNSSGSSLGVNYLICNPLYAGYAQEHPEVGINGSNAYFCWMDTRNGSWDIYAKVVDWTPYTCGDANGDNKVTVSDVVFLVNYLFKGGPPPFCPPPALMFSCVDANGDGNLTVSDVIYLVNYLFKGGPPPAC